MPRISLVSVCRGLPAQALRWLGMTWDEGPDIGGLNMRLSEPFLIERHALGQAANSVLQAAQLQLFEFLSCKGFGCLIPEHVGWAFNPLSEGCRAFVGASA